MELQLFFVLVTVDVHLESESHEKRRNSGTPEPEDFIMDMAPNCSIGYHQEQITRCLKLYMPCIKFLDERGPELRYLVPLDQPHLLARLFDQLDSNLTVMRIASYGLSACSMEQVFVALNEERSDVSTDGKYVCVSVRPCGCVYVYMYIHTYVCVLYVDMYSMVI